MICNRCARRLAAQGVPHIKLASSQRFVSAIASSNLDTNTPRPHGHPAATSTSAAQPFTAGTLPRPGNPVEQVKSKPRQPSAAPEGTVLKGINFMKNQQDPIAMADDQYPEWLWRALDKTAKAGAAAEDEGDLFSKSKKQRTKAAKALRKRQLVDPSLLHPPVPLHEQTIDLYAGDGTVEGAKRAVEERAKLTKSMREARRAKIRETNFLKAMS